MRIWSSIMLVLLLVAPTFARQDQPSPAPIDVRALFDEGQAAFDEGLAKREHDSAAAAKAFERAASIWQSIIDEHDIHNGALLYNIGNAHLLAGQLGPAILAYRKAELYLGGEHHLVSNLQQARRKVMTRIEAQPSAMLERTLLFWHDDWSTRTRLMLLTVLSGVAWLWGLARLNARFAAWPRWPGWASGAIALALAGSLMVEQMNAGEHIDGVVMQDVVGRKGPSEAGYEPSFTEPLAEGVEFTVAEDRQDWLLARLADGRETWLRRDAVGLVN